MRSGASGTKPINISFKNLFSLDNNYSIFVEFKVLRILHFLKGGKSSSSLGLPVTKILDLLLVNPSYMHKHSSETSALLSSYFI